MNWLKTKQLFSPNHNYDWMYSHAANPFPYILDENKEIVRIFFTTRNFNNESHIGFIDFNFKNDYEIINISEKPILAPGEIGTFDVSGTAMGYLFGYNEKF